MVQIESAQNPKFKFLKELLSSKGIKTEGHFLLSGKKLILECLKNKSDAKFSANFNTHFNVAYEVLTDEMEPLTDLSPQNILHLKKELFKVIDVIGTKFNILVLKLPHISQLDISVKPQKPEVILPLGDPHNLGAMIRSCVAFGFKKIILTQEAAHPFLPKVIKSSSGAVLKAELFWGPSVHDITSPCLALTADGKNIQNFSWPAQFRLLVGEEGLGLPPHIPVTPLSIDMTNEVESLNATVAMSIALHQARTYLLTQKHK